MLDIVLSVAAGVYVACAIVLTVFVASFGALLVIYLRTRGDAPVLPLVDDDALLSVTVQLPIYNETHVVERLIDACAALDYPPGKLHVQVIDDSDDDTTVAIRRRIAEWQARGIRHLELLRRPQRSGYKAGALAHGLERTTTACVAVFDADFVPPRDFLRRTMPNFSADDRLALVQTRWDHLNHAANWLTRAQALTIDGHFVVEQTARSRGGLPLSMNGTGGLWRVSALRAAGGWSAATLTEDLDVSYRALLRGWEFLYLPDVAVPGELPPQVQAYKRQQRRWATGMTQCLLRHAGPLRSSGRYSAAAKFMGLMHLAQYAAQPPLLAMFLLTPVLLWADMFRRLPDLRWLGAVGIIPPLIMVAAQAALYPDWRRRLLLLPVQGMLGAGLALNNTCGVLSALWRPGKPREFKRTPKFHDTGRDRTWRASRYRLRPDAVTLGELALGTYAAVGVVLAVRVLPLLAPYLLSYAASFWGLAVWNLSQTRRVPARARRAAVYPEDIKARAR